MKNRIYIWRNLMARILKMILLLLLSLSWIGCGSASAKLLGRWEIETQPSADKNIASTFANNLAASFSMSLNFSADGNLTFQFSFLGKETTKTGTWKHIGSQDKVMVIAVTPEGQKAPTEVSVTFIDNDHIELIPPQGSPQQGTLRFKRAAIAKTP